jgi:hypothetical protein
VAGAARHLKLDVTGDFLCHVTLDFPSKWYFEGG